MALRQFDQCRRIGFNAVVALLGAAWSKLGLFWVDQAWRDLVLEAIEFSFKRLNFGL